MSENTETTNLSAAETPKVEIIRGRMPVAVVALIRFKEEGVATAALAAKYRTTVGKVDDIKKCRNFGYVTEDFKPTPEQVEAAKGYLSQLSDENSADAIAKLEGMGLADDDGAAFEAARLAFRKRKAPAEDTQASPSEPDSAPDAPADEIEETDMSEFTE
jgi:hypothetical protein